MSIYTSSHFVSVIKKVVSPNKHTIKVLLAVVVVPVSIFAYRYVSPAQAVDETVVVTTGELKQYVSVTGAVQSSKDANLSFQTLGTVTHLNVKVGDKVSAGETLASLNDSDAVANLLQAKAQLASAEAVLSQLTEGARKEEVAIKQQAVDNAKNSLDQSYSSLPDTIRNVDSTTADIIKNKLNSLFVNNTGRYNLSFSSCDQNLQSTIETSRTKLETTLSDYQKKSGDVTTYSDEAYIDEVFEQAYAVTVATNNLVNTISNLLLTSCSTQNASLDPARANLTLVKATINTLFTDLSAKRTALNLAKNTLAGVTRDLDLTKAGTDPYKLKSQSAVVSQAVAQVAQAESGLRKTIIVAPFSGTISDVTISQGETVTSGKTVISMLAVDAFEVEAKVPEVDIVKIKNGAHVEVTLDAYGKGVIFPAVVTRINPTATIEGSVPMYKVIITFSEKDDRIKSGMTANVNIITESKDGVITLPARFVQVKDEGHGTVLVKSATTNEKRDVVLGSRGQGGLFEIISGVTIGEVIVAPSIGVRSAQKQTN